jgi:uncharacterized membrane protein YciS (DUF1049 family)
MKKLKYVFWLLLIAFFGVIIYQNWDYVTTVNDSLKLNLFVYNKPIPPLTNGAIIAICVGVGVLITMLFYLASRYEAYRAKKTIKTLRSSMEESKKSISELKQEVELLKGGSPALPTDPSGGEEGQESTAPDSASAEQAPS